MAQYKPVDLEAQRVPGTFAHGLHHLVDLLDLSAFDAHHCNDEVGTSAHAPAMLLNEVLLAYSQSMASSQSIRGRRSTMRAPVVADRRTP